MPSSETPCADEPIHRGPPLDGPGPGAGPPGGVRGEVPVGAVLVRDGALLAEGHNLTVTTSDPTAHAEVVAIRKAAALQGDWRLEGTTLYCTLEPCTLCCGAIILARVPRVVYRGLGPEGGNGRDAWGISCRIPG